jgi:hypothetical protein
MDGEYPRIGDLVFNPHKNSYGVCVALFGEKGWAKIKWAYKDRPIVRPIYNVVLIKRSNNE